MVPMPADPSRRHPDGPADPEEWWNYTAGAAPGVYRPDPDTEWRRRHDEHVWNADPEFGPWDL